MGENRNWTWQFVSLQLSEARQAKEVETQDQG